MAKVIYKGLAKKDDPIYTGKYVVSSFKKKIINKKEKKMGKVIKSTIITKENIHLHPEYQNGNTSILFGANLVKRRKKKAESNQTEKLTEQEKIAIFKNRYWEVWNE